jgi:tetratricopeptide (TPR) repeat protein
MNSQPKSKKFELFKLGQAGEFISNSMLGMLVFALLITIPLLVIYVIFKIVPSVAWSAAEIWSHVGAIGWAALLPVLMLLIYEVLKHRSERGASTTASSTGARPSRWPWTSLVLGSLVVVGNGSLNIAASRVDGLWHSRQVDGVDIYRNHDLARLVGQCVRLAILRHAESLGGRPKEQRALRLLANHAPEQWLILSETTDGKDADPRVVALSEASLVDFISEPSARALNQKVWHELLRDWSSKLGASDVSETTLNGCADAIAADFGITLREALKSDFTKGGKAWASMQLDIAQRLLNSTKISASVDNLAIKDALDKIDELVSDDAVGLPALRRILLDVKQAQDQYAVDVATRFDQLSKTLASIRSEVTQTRRDVEALKGTANSIHEQVGRLVAAQDSLSQPMQEWLRLQGTEGFKRAQASGPEATATVIDRLKFMQDQLDSPTRVNSKFLREYAAIAFLAGKTSLAQDTLLKLTISVPDDLDAVNMLGWTYHRQGNDKEAEKVYNNLLGHQDPNSAVAAAAYANLANIAQRRGDRAHAKDLHQRALAIHRAIGDRVLESADLGNLALVEKAMGNLDDAETHLQDAIRLAKEENWARGLGSHLANLGIVQREREEFEPARMSLEEARDIASRIGDRKLLGNCIANLGMLELDLGETGSLDVAETLLVQAIALHIEAGDTEAIAICKGNLGVALWRRGKLDDAEKVIQKAIDIDVALGRIEGQANHLANLGAIAEQRQDFQTARDRYTRSKKLFEDAGMRKYADLLQSWIDALPQA